MFFVVTKSSYENSNSVLNICLTVRPYYVMSNDLAATQTEQNTTLPRMVWRTQKNTRKLKCGTNFPPGLLFPLQSVVSTARN